MWSLIAILGALVTWAGSPVELAVDRIDRLYLHRAEVDEATLLRSAARELAGRVHWLTVEIEGRGVVLTHGDGRALGRVEARDMADLPRALEDLAGLVGGVEPGPRTDPEVLQQGVLAGLARGLDGYSRVLTGRRIDGFSVRLSGTESGVGVTLGERDDQVFVEAVVPNGPAPRAGLGVGDRLTAIDGEAVTTAAEASRGLRGASGSAVLVAVEGRDGARSVSLRRARVVVPNVRHRVLPGRVGYVHIEHVSQRTVENLRDAFAALRARGALDRGLVIDLRGNTGGSMKEAARIADLFVSDGLLLRTEGRDGGPIENLQHEMTARPAPDDLDVPIVLVVDERTASGAEILTGALVEHGRAAVVGQRTWGKGTVQKPMSLGEGLQLNLTVARYVLQNERRIGPSGIVPDVWIGHVETDGVGLRFEGWPEATGDWSEVVPAVAGEVELARRALLAVSADPLRDPRSRATVLGALRTHARAMRREGQRRLETVAEAGGLDWSAVPPVPRPDVDLGLVLHAVDNERVRLEAEVVSHEDVPIPQLVVQLRSSEPLFDGVAVAVGRVEPGASARGATLLDLARPGPARLERVEAFVRVGPRPAEPAGDHLLTVPEVVAPTGEGPHVLVEAPGLAAPPMRIALPIRVDDRGGVPVDHVVVWANGRKVAWSAGETLVDADHALRPWIDLRPGPNRVLVEAVDALGRTRDVRLQILGIPAPTPGLSMDATGDASEPAR